MSRRTDREERLSELAAKVKRKGEFIHIDRRRPRLGGADYVAPGTLKELEDRGVVVVVQSDLLGYPMQYANKRTTRRVAR